nr:diphthamide biosynthesis protein 2 [Quercus suber]
MQTRISFLEPSRKMAAPVLSTPAEHILEEPATATQLASPSQLSEEQLYLQYEIKRTVDEIKRGKWHRVALQFPDDMLVDAPRVFERLRDDLRAANSAKKLGAETRTVTEDLSKVLLEDESSRLATPQNGVDGVEDETETRLCILGDTSYGACCVDEVAAEHVDADVVVHYGRSCLSPTARLPVVYIFTSKQLDLEAAATSFSKLYTDRTEKVCLMADIPYHHHISALAELVRTSGYSNTFAPAIVHDPSSLLPNRTLPPGVSETTEKLQDYSIFHISTPPTSLLLTLSSRVKRIHIYSPATPTSRATESSSSALLRRRYGLITRLSSVSIFGILINTLSVSNYLTALSHCQELIAAAGKKSYVFVVGKVNAAKVANFAEIGGWVVIGCWESSLIESSDFYRPIITPFELELALQSDEERLWNGEWVGDFATVLRRERVPTSAIGKIATTDSGNSTSQSGYDDGTDLQDHSSEDEPPEFDLRTGRYVSHSRPMGRRQQQPPSSSTLPGTDSEASTSNPAALGSNASALIQRANGGLATINGSVSPAAEFLRSRRTWTGLGSDLQIAYERDDHGKIQGAKMEEGRAGVARGYGVGKSDEERR